MRLQLIRNATLRLRYAGRTLLVDPDLAARHARPAFTGRSANPMIDLPLPVDQILDGVELVLVSHLHRDHFYAVDAIPRHVPVLCQPGDEGRIAELGFADLTPVEPSVEWGGITLTRTGGRHGRGDVEAQMGRVSGFVLAAAGEPTVYWAGDTLLCDEVRDALARYAPKVVVIHASGATWPDGHGGRELIVMDAAQAVEVCRLAPDALVVATHMEAIDHGTVSRAALREAARAAGARLLVPEDGETLGVEI